MESRIVEIPLNKLVVAALADAERLALNSNAK